MSYRVIRSSKIMQVGNNTEVYITLDGAVQFFNKDDRFCSRAKGPAVIWPNGYVRFTSNSEYSSHRTDGPAAIYADGAKEYAVCNNMLEPEEFFLKFGTL